MVTEKTVGYHPVQSQGGDLKTRRLARVNFVADSETWQIVVSFAFFGPAHSDILSGPN
jgi:hypothetical protein